MDEISQYFNDLRRDLKSKQGVASVRDKNAKRKGPNFEERSYEVYIKEKYHDDLERVASELQRELSVETKIETTENYIIVESGYDAN